MTLQKLVLFGGLILLVLASKGQALSTDMPFKDLPQANIRQMYENIPQAEVEQMYTLSDYPDGSLKGRELHRLGRAVNSPKSTTINSQQNNWFKKKKNSGMCNCSSGGGYGNYGGGCGGGNSGGNNYGHGNGAGCGHGGGHGHGHHHHGHGHGHGHDGCGDDDAVPVGDAPWLLTLLAVAYAAYKTKTKK